MLDKWEIDDFKSIGSAVVDLAPGHMTVLTGKNSIGKSSLLQSLLFACQSIDSDRFATNGALVRLGSPFDIIRKGEKSLVIKYAFTMRFASESSTRKTSVKLRLKPRVQGDGAKTRLCISEVTLTSANAKGRALVSMHCTDVRMRGEDVAYCRNKLSHYEDCDVLRIDEMNGLYTPRTYVVFKGFKAVAVIVRKEERWMRRAIAELFENSFGSKSKAGMGVADRFFIDAMAASFKDYDDESFKYLCGLRRKQSNGFSQEEVETLRRILDSILDERVKESYVLKYTDRSRHYSNEDLLSFVEMDELDALATQLEECNRNLGVFDNRVIYIGPLRDDPRSFSDAWQESARHCPVGKKGEQTAAVLESIHNLTITAGLPYKEHRSQSITVGEAVSAWAHYLGVGDSIGHSSFQKMGAGIRVASKRGVHDLTAVGVGASQVIPVLVGVLAAREGSIVLLEQPEIHLHPSAQARLADFLLFARSDLTVVLETHSEALLTRIRRRVAEGTLSNGENSPSNVRILFMEEEKGDVGGSAPVIARSLSINEYGNLSEWPQGFMDAVQEDSRAIMMLAARKDK